MFCNLVVYYITFLVSEVSISVLELTKSVIGLAHELECTFLVPDGVSPFLVNITWIGSPLLSESPRIVESNLTNNGSLYTRIITFVPLLNRDIGKYFCFAEITGFDETMSSENLTVIANGT